MLEVLRCPSCDAEIRFDPGSSLSTCQYCGAQVKQTAPAASPGARLAEAISIKALPDRAIPLIERGTPLPASHSETLASQRDDQDAVHITLQAGGDPNPDGNRPLASITLPLEQKKPRGMPVGQLSIEVAADGQVRIQAREEGTTRTLSCDAAVAVEG